MKRFHLLALPVFTVLGCRHAPPPPLPPAQIPHRPGQVILIEEPEEPLFDEPAGPIPVLEGLPRVAVVADEVGSDSARMPNQRAARALANLLTENGYGVTDVAGDPPRAPSGEIEADALAGVLKGHTDMLILAETQTTASYDVKILARIIDVGTPGTMGEFARASGSSRSPSLTAATEGALKDAFHQFHSAIHDYWTLRHRGRFLSATLTASGFRSQKDIFRLTRGIRHLPGVFYSTRTETRYPSGGVPSAEFFLLYEGNVGALREAIASAPLPFQITVAGETPQGLDLRVEYP